jgi:hypothetical protein
MFTRNFWILFGISEFNLMGFEVCKSAFWSRKRIVSIVTMLQIGHKNVPTPGQVNKFFSNSDLDKLWDSTSLLPNT